jgi:glycosyltransferase involved in cell wall biosynthesis
MNKTGLIIGTLPGKYIGIAAGGIATHIGGLIDSLQKKSVKIWICYHKPFGIRHPEVINSTKVGWLGAVCRGTLKLLFSRNFHFSRYSLKNNLLIAYYVGTLDPFLKEHKPDFIHVHSLHNPAGVALSLLGWQGNRIVTDHGFWLTLYNRKQLTLLRDNYAWAHHVIYISDIAYNEHKKAGLGDMSKLVKIPNPSSFGDYPVKLAGAAAQSAKKIIFFNGYKESLETKGLRFLLEAMDNDKYLCDNTELWILCNDEAQEYIKGRRWKCNLRVYGRKSFPEILEMYRRADILVVPSKFESFGLVYTEALAVGIPVIGYHAVIDEFRNTLGQYIGCGIDIGTENPNDLAGKIKDVLNAAFDAPAVRGALIHNYDWNILLERFLSLYYPEQIASSNPLS